MNSPNNRPKPSSLTKVLVSKIQGRRKKDSKFWTIDNDIPTSVHEAQGRTTHRRNKKLALYPLLIIITIISLMIVVRPSLFPFLSYHNIYEAISKYFPNDQKIAPLQPATPNIQPATPNIPPPVDKKPMSQDIQFYYRVTLIDGGIVKGKNLIRKGNMVDIFDNNKITTTLNIADIKNIEKVYYNLR